MPVTLDLGAVGDIEAHAGEDLLDALHGQADRVQAAGLTQASGQGDIEGLGLQLDIEFRVGQRLPAGVQGSLNGLLGGVDCRAAGLLLQGAQRGHTLHQLGDAAGLADELRLGVFQVGGCYRTREGGAGGVDNGFKFDRHSHR